jgi:hypothetical protein
MVFNDHCAYVHILSLKLYETDTPQSIQELSKSIYIPRGINTEALDRTIKWDFAPTDIKVPFPICYSALDLKILATDWRPCFWRRHIWQGLRELTR